MFENSVKTSKNIYRKFIDIPLLYLIQKSCIIKLNKENVISLEI